MAHLAEKRAPTALASPSFDVERVAVANRAAYITDMAHQLKRMALTDGHETAAYMLEMTVLEMRTRIETT